jgi:hypothetical protein
LHFLLLVIMVVALIATPFAKGCLKIIFFIFAALAALALIGSLSHKGKKQTTIAATEIESRAFTAPTAFLNATPYANVLGRKGKYASPTTPKRSTNPAHEENAKRLQMVRETVKLLQPH